MLYYCKKCGRIVENRKNEEFYQCDYCQTLTHPVPEKYWLDGLDFLITNESEQLLREELVKTSSEFDQYLFEHRDQDMFNKRMADEAKLEHGKAILEGRDKGNPYGMTCPYCHATNIKKISTASRMISTGLFGLASSKIGKTYKCSKCGSTW